MDFFNDRKFVPMLLDEASVPFNDPDFIFELKFDGIRTLLFIGDGKITIQNKRGDILNSRYPELLSIKNNIKNKVIFDGELILMVDGKPDFSMLQKRSLLKDKMKINYYVDNYPVVFVAYDILYENEDLTHLSLLERKKILNKYKDSDNFIKVIYIEKNGIDLFEEIKKLGLEGIVAKKKDSIYRINKRSNDWIKIKNLKDEDFYICGFKEDKDIAVASLLLGKKKGKSLVYAGRVTIGRKNPEYLIIKKVALNKHPDFLKDGFVYINPTFKCTVVFMEKSRNDMLRQPVYKGLIL